MRFHQKNELKTIFNVPKYARHGALQLAYLQEHGGHKKNVLFDAPNMEHA